MVIRLEDVLHKVPSFTHAQVIGNNGAACPSSLTPPFFIAIASWKELELKFFS
jgi:hypothetical protein